MSAWGFAPDPTREAYSAPPDPLAGFNGAASQQDGNGGEGREGRRGLGEGKRGRERKGGMGTGGKKWEVGGGIAP